MYETGHNEGKEKKKTQDNHSSGADSICSRSKTRQSEYSLIYPEPSPPNFFPRSWTWSQS